MSTKIGGINRGSAYMVTDNINSMSTNLTASVLLSSTPVTLYGLIVNSHTSGTIKFWDSTTPSGTIATDTYSFATGSQSIDLYGITTGTACYVAVGGTASVTLAYRRNKDVTLDNNPL